MIDAVELFKLSTCFINYRAIFKYLGKSLFHDNIQTAFKMEDATIATTSPTCRYLALAKGYEQFSNQTD